MVGPTDALVSELASIVGAEAVKSGALDRHLYSKDAGVVRGDVSVVVLPKTARQVAAIVRTAVAHGVPVVPRGAGTGLTGGAVPEGAAILLVTTRMDQVDVDAANRTAWVGPGVINLDLSNQTASLGIHFAPDPSSQAACTIGGNVANNSGVLTVWLKARPSTTCLPSNSSPPVARSLWPDLAPPTHRGSTSAG